MVAISSILCLKGDELGKVIISISYQSRLNQGLFLPNFTRLPLVARTFYLRLHERFIDSFKLPPQRRGYELEKIFTDLMKISNIPVEESFKIEGEQIDGAIKYDSYYYIVELKWTANKVNQAQISSLYMKVEGKMQSLGLFISMNGYSQEALESLTRGKPMQIILLDGTHLMSVISGIRTFKELLEHARKEASLKGNIYCSHDIS
ncbi:restriction endonuclease [Anabaena sphaerica]|uniref:restriction endonuclease n=1 Tax=Anabaena sphaerica TaxID=212446 RepID=UPI001A7EF947|nr:restriction endonuclease [Anabaena sphaerica]